MNQLNSKFKILEKSWRKLKRLHPTTIDLERISLIHEKNLEFLSNTENIKLLMLDLGLNDDGLEEIPENLHPYCGQGLRIWQYPIQFSKYLVDLSKLKIKSYMELGTRHGGTFVTTVEFLDKFHPLEFAIGIDIMPCPSMAEYQKINPKIEFIKINTQTPDFAKVIEKYEQLDLVFIDSNHEEFECRNEFNLLKQRANIIVFHDINNIDFPGVKKVWNEVKRMDEYNCFEYVEQYEGIGPYMGIGMAVRKDRQEKISNRKILL
jgi:cephalosporin hydroxylase